MDRCRNLEKNTEQNFKEKEGCKKESTSSNWRGTKTPLAGEKKFFKEDRLGGETPTKEGPF